MYAGIKQFSSGIARTSVMVGHVTKISRGRGESGGMLPKKIFEF